MAEKESINIQCPIEAGGEMRDVGTAMATTQQGSGGGTNGKSMPNLDQNSTKLLNLTVLQWIDPFVEEILITAAHVTFYEFNIDLNQWSRKDVEGSFFVVKRNTQPIFQFIVMNRRNTGY